eukprot:scaffold13191_cov178-Amphora_coffeaeformis.AAC.7
MYFAFEGDQKLPISATTTAAGHRPTRPDNLRGRRDVVGCNGLFWNTDTQGCAVYTSSSYVNAWSLQLVAMTQE